MPMLMRGRWAVWGQARVVSGRDASLRGRRESCAGPLAGLADWLARVASPEPQAVLRGPELWHCISERRSARDSQP